MSAFTRLWRRAPLWRTTLILTGVCSTFALLFPAPWLERSLPLYQRGTDKIGHMLGRESAAQKAADADNQGRRMVSQPPMDAQLEGVIPFAGRQLPLPAGHWHPVLNYQDDVAHGELLTSLYVRSERGMVTGFIIAQATTQSLPSSNTQMWQDMCHNTFNFTAGDLPQDGNRTECWMTAPIKVVNNQFITSNQALQGLVSSPLFIPPALQRLSMMGFALPPVLVDAGWVHIEKSKSGNGVDFASVHIFVSPAQAGEHVTIPGAPEDWSKPGMNNSPDVADFVQRTSSWLQHWTPELRKGYTGTLDTTAWSAILAADPGFHG